MVRAKDYTGHEDAHVTLWRTYEWLTCEADDYPAHEELLLIGRLRAERREFGGSRRLEVRFHELDSGEVISLVENTVTVPEDEDAGVCIWHFEHRLTATFADARQYAADAIIEGVAEMTLPMYGWGLRLAWVASAGDQHRHPTNRNISSERPFRLLHRIP